ncbi:MAG: hypothetical protein IPJ77_00190 [Planctomycetes bacterium]|nr:hypothetical protein [Planctomycetota bacterium]
MSAVEELLVVHHAGRTTPFVASARRSLSWFGGPRVRTVRGAAHGPRALHAIAALSPEHVLALRAPLPGSVLPLVYGLAYDACELEYAYDLDAIELASIAPARSEDDWPYPHYPELLPYVPVEPGAPRAESWDAFAARFGGLARAAEAELVVVVPPPATIGQSLWGPDGDAEGATIVFACSPRERRVSAWNVCA